MTRIAEQRRGEILEAAARCFRRRGFHQSSMKEVCAEAGISPGVVYHHFESKEAIIAALAQEERQTILKLMAKVHECGTLGAALDLLAEAVLTSVSAPGEAALYLEITIEAGRNPAVLEAVRGADEAFYGGLVQLLRAARERGEIAREGPVEPMADAVAALLEGFIVRAATEPNPLSHLPAAKMGLRSLTGCSPD